MRGHRGRAVVSLENPACLERASELLGAGEVIALPTDTVYGLASLALDADAQQRLFDIKRRPARFSIAVLAADVATAESLVRFTPLARLLAERFWPGPLTLVAPMLPGLPAHLGNGSTLGVRVPAEQLVRRLAAPPGVLGSLGSRFPSRVSTAAGSVAVGSDGARPFAVGPLAVTSANLHGEATPTSAADIAEMFPDLRLVIDGGVRCGPASTVVDATGDQPVVLRDGGVSREALAAACEDPRTSST